MGGSSLACSSTGDTSLPRNTPGSSSSPQSLLPSFLWFEHDDAASIEAQHAHLFTMVQSCCATGPPMPCAMRLNTDALLTVGSTLFSHSCILSSSECTFRIKPRDPLHLLCSYKSTTAPKKKEEDIAGVATNRVPGCRSSRPDPHLPPKNLHVLDKHFSSKILKRKLQGKTSRAKVNPLPSSSSNV